MGSDYISFGLCLSFYFQGIVKFSIFVRRGLLVTCRVLPITIKSFKFFGFSTEEVKCRNARLSHFIRYKGWSGGAVVLGKLPVPGRPTIWI